MLPFWNGEGLASPKYGNIAIEKLMDKMLMSGAQKRNIIAKVYGGAEVIEFSSNHYKIGDRNLDLAKSVLSENLINVIEHNTAGKNGRRIQFNTYTGEVKIRFIQNSSTFSK
jgi:chemotaxis protein CheD